MIRSRIPGALPKGGDLRVVEHIGTLGYSHSQVLADGSWRPGGIIYLHPEVVSVTWEIVGRVNSRLKAVPEMVAPPKS